MCILGTAWDSLFLEGKGERVGLEDLLDQAQVRLEAGLAFLCVPLRNQEERGGDWLPEDTCWRRLLLVGVVEMMRGLRCVLEWSADGWGVELKGRAFCHPNMLAQRGSKEHTAPSQCLNLEVLWHQLSVQSVTVPSAWGYSSGSHKSKIKGMAGPCFF